MSMERLASRCGGRLGEEQSRAGMLVYWYLGLVMSALQSSRFWSSANPSQTSSDSASVESRAGGSRNISSALASRRQTAHTWTSERLTCGSWRSSLTMSSASLLGRIHWDRFLI